MKKRRTHHVQIQMDLFGNSFSVSWIPTYHLPFTFPANFHILPNFLCLVMFMLHARFASCRPPRFSLVYSLSHVPITFPFLSRVCALASYVPRRLSAYYRGSAPRRRGAFANRPIDAPEASKVAGRLRGFNRLQLTGASQPKRLPVRANALAR